MNITLTMSHTTHRSLLVGCSMNPCNQSALSTPSISHVGRFNPTVMDLDMTKERIRKMFSNVELSVSSYDTAWVAMVPSPKSPKSPCFPECLKWLMDNQLNDGSWCLVYDNPPFSLLKDSLSSTLACILALKRWNIAADDQINKGLCFIESNIGSATDKNQPSPLGFDIIFPHMLEHAKQLNITLPVKQTDLSLMLHQRELELTRCHSKERGAYLAYVSEGLGNFYDQNMVMKYQMKNGSILNSPSATAAALIHHHNATSLDYLTSLVKKFGNAVPTLYPLDLYLRLYMVEELERLGIWRHFKMEIQTVLDETYSYGIRYWMQRDEQIFMDVGTCALAFRVLRTNGYQISSDPLDEISQLEEPFKDVNEALDAYRASQIIYQDELAFGTLNLRSADFLKRKIITSSNRLSKFHQKEVVEDALKFPLSASLERASARRYIKHYNVHDSRMLKTTYRSSNISNKDYLRLAVEDYNACQFIYRRELKDFERWVEHNELDKLKFARQKAGYCYFSAISIFPSPEQLDARMSFAKSSMLAIVMDDFFDVGGSMDEYANLVHCVEKWDVNVDSDCCSEDVRIMFLALKDAVTWTGDAAFKLQGRDVTSHVKETWLRLIKSNLTEAKWVNDGRVPTLNEYMETAHVSFTLGALVFPALYFIGPKLTEEVVQSAEFHTLFKLMSTHGRLLNDIRTFQRELKAGRINAVTLHKNYGKGGIEDEEIIKEIELSIEDQEKKLLQLVLEEKESIVPGACKEAFWKMCNVINFFYATHDGFTANDILESVKEVIYEPVVSVRADR